MSLAVDTRYRSIRIAWTNYDAQGAETVQIFAKPSGGSWSLVRSVPVSGVSQSTTWVTALPITEYEIAIRYVNGSIPGEGYSGGDPDNWTAPTAPGARTTVTTRTEEVTWVGGTFVNAATPLTLQWTSAQTGVPYLLEKNAGAGWETVASDLVATSYVYTVPSGELNTTVQFRVTPKRGAITGDALTVSVPMFVTVGDMSLTAGAFDSSTGRVLCSWTFPSNADYVRLEWNPDNTGWGTLGTFMSGTLSYSVPVPSTYLNKTVKFRASGQRGTTVGNYTPEQSVVCTYVPLAAPTLSVAFNVPSEGLCTLSWTAVAGAYSYQLRLSPDGVSYPMEISVLGLSQVESIYAPGGYQYAKVCGYTEGGYYGDFSNVVRLAP